MKRFLLIFLLIGIGQFCLGQGTCKLKGVVLLYDLDMKKEPLPDISVELLHDSRTTDSKGEFKLDRDCSVKDVTAVPSNFRPAEKGRYEIFDPARLYYTVSEKPFEVLMCDAKKREKIILKYFNLIDEKYKKKYEEAKQKLDETSKDYEEKIRDLQSQFRDRSKIQEQAEKFFLIDKTTCDSIMLQAKELLDSGMVEEAFSILQKAPNLEGLEQLVLSARDILHRNIQRYDMLVVANDLRDRPDENLREQYYDSLIYYYRFGVKELNVNESFKTNFAATLYRYAKTTYMGVPGEKVFPLLKESADLGYAAAQYDLGRYYESEMYYQKDSMLYWYQRSAKQGYEDAVVRMNRYPDFYAINKHGDTIYYSINADSISVSVTYLDDQHPYNYQEVNIPKTVVPDAIFNKSDIDAHDFSPTKNKCRYSVTQIGYHAFGYCLALKSLSLPSVKSIGKIAFSMCKSLEYVKMGDDLEIIGVGAFWGCEGLKEVVLPESLKSIGDYAFGGCNELVLMKIPDGVTAIGYDAFPKIPKLVIKTNNHHFRVLDSLICFDNELIWHSPSITGRLVVPDGVTSIGVNFFRGCKSLKGVVFPESLKSIGDYAFGGCESLKEVVFPESLRSIGKSAFNGCSKLLSVRMPDGVTSVGDYVFCDCESLKEVVFPESLRSIGKSAFNGCSKLLSVRIPDGVTSIGESAFRGCESLKEVVLPDSLKSIGESAFCDCRSLKEVVLPELLESISNYAFGGCYKLELMKIPNGVNSIGIDAFPKTPKLVVETNNSHFRVLDSIICFDDKLIWCNPSITGRLVVPDGVTSIGVNAFSVCKGLKEVVLPESLMSIGKSAFNGCRELESIKIPDGVTSIGDYAFRGCKSLKVVVLPESLDLISDYAFDDCKSLKEVVLPKLLKSIGKSAFNGCGKLISIRIPNGVTSIGDYAFGGCESLKEVVLPESLKSIGDYAFGGCNELVLMKIPDGVTAIGYDAFPKIPKLVIKTNNHHFRVLDSLICFDNELIWCNPSISGRLVVPDGVISIGSVCKGLKEVVLPESLKSIGKSAFNGCRELESIKIPDGVTSIDIAAFCNCNNLKEVVLPESLKSICKFAFRGCSELDSIKIPDRVTSIGDHAFGGCKSLKEVVLPDSLRLIGLSIFSGCSGLKSIVIPKGSLPHFKKILIESYHHLLVEK